MKSKEELDAERLKRAQELADLVKRGGKVPHGDPYQNSWPDRGKVKKDEEAMKRIFGEDV